MLRPDAHAGNSSSEEVYRQSSTITAYPAHTQVHHDRLLFEEGINPELLQLLAKHARLELPVVMKRARADEPLDVEALNPRVSSAGRPEGSVNPRVSSAGGPSRRVSSSSNPALASQSRRTTAQSLEPQSEGGAGSSKLQQAVAKRKAGLAASLDAPRAPSPDLSKARRVSPHRQQQIEAKDRAAHEQKIELEMRRRQRESEAVERAWSPPGKDRQRAQAAAVREREEATKAAAIRGQAASAFADKLKRAGEKARKAKEEEDRLRADRLRQETAAESEAAREATKEAAVVATDGEKPAEDDRDEDEEGYDNDPDHEGGHGQPEHVLAAERVRAQKKKREAEKQRAEAEACEQREDERQARIASREQRDVGWRAHMVKNAPGQDGAPRPHPREEEELSLGPLLDVIADEPPPSTLTLVKPLGGAAPRHISPGREGAPRAKDLDAAGRAELKSFMERRQKEAERREREEKEASMALTLMRTRTQKEEADRARLLARRHAQKIAAAAAAAAQDPAVRRRASSATRPAWIDPSEPAFDPADDPLKHLMRSLANVPVVNRDPRSISAERRRRPDFDAISLRRMPNSTELALLAEYNGETRARVVSVDRSIAQSAAARQKERSIRQTSRPPPPGYNATSLITHGLSGIPEHSQYDDEMYDEEEEEEEARVIRLRDPAYDPLPLPSHPSRKKTVGPQFPLAAAASTAAAGRGGIGGGGISMRARDTSPSALTELRCSPFVLVMSPVMSPPCCLSGTWTLMHDELQ